MMVSFGYTLKGLLASIPISHSNEIMLQGVLEFIKTLKKQLLKDWCAQTWSKAVRFGTPGCSQEELESVQKCGARFVTL